MTRSLWMRLLSVLMSLVLMFTLSEPASAKGEYRPLRKASVTRTEGSPEDPEDRIFPYDEEVFVSPEVIGEEINNPVLSPFDHEALEIKDSSIRGELPEKRDESLWMIDLDSFAGKDYNPSQS